MKGLVRALGQGAGAWLAQSRLTGYLIQTSNTTIGQGQYLGTNTNDDASAGNIGEIATATLVSSSAVSLTNNVTARVLSISLTAGDWDAVGIAAFQPTSTTTQDLYSTFLSSRDAAGVPSIQGGGATISFGNTATGGSGREQWLVTSPLRVSLATTETRYLNVYQLFGVSTLTAYGSIRARRIR